jgi:hypothetical protein
MSAFDGVHGTVCNETQWNQSQLSSNSRTPSISCLTHGQSTGLAVSMMYLSFSLELTPCTADSRSVGPQLPKHHRHFCMDGCTSTSFHGSVLFDQILHSGTYDGIERHSQRATGSCSRGLLTSTWSASQFSGCPFLGSSRLLDSSPSSYSIFCRPWAVSSISNGLTGGS